jgi:hypothetical protein
MMSLDSSNARTTEGSGAPDLEDGGPARRQSRKKLVRRQGRAASRGPRAPKGYGRGKAQRILSDDRVRELHEAYKSREPIIRLAADAYVSVTFLYGRFRALGLPTSVNDKSACERALMRAHKASGAASLSWHGYQALRREHPHWPCASTVERVLGGGSWTAAKRAAGLLPTQAWQGK